MREIGPNAVRRHRAEPFAVLFRQLRNPLLLLLAAAAAISMATGQGTDAIIILAIVGLSVGLGFVNEFRSEPAIETLHSQIRHTVVAVRDGRVLRLDVTDLVPGDLVELDVGDVVPADLRLLEATKHHRRIGRLAVRRVRVDPRSSSGRPSLRGVPRRNRARSAR